jgi:preprotein translocase subunit SecD
MKTLLPLLAIPVAAAVGAFVGHVAVDSQPTGQRNATLLLRIDHTVADRERLWRVAAILEDHFARKDIPATFEMQSATAIRVRIPSEASSTAGAIVSAHAPTLQISNPSTGILELRYSPEDLQRNNSATPNRIAQVLRERLVHFGIREPHLQNVRQFVWVSLPKLSERDIANAKRVVTRRARLELRLVDDTADVLERIAQLPPTNGIAVRRDTFDGRTRGKIRYVEISSKNTLQLHAYIDQAARQVGVPPHREILIGPDTDDLNNPIQVAYLVYRGAHLTGDDVADAVVQMEAQGQPEVGATLTPNGARVLADLTESHVGWRLAIVMDGKVSGAPVIQSRIEGGRLRITMSKTPNRLEESRELVALLLAGGLPAPLVLDSAHIR